MCVHKETEKEEERESKKSDSVHMFSVGVRFPMSMFTMQNTCQSFNCNEWFCCCCRFRRRDGAYVLADSYARYHIQQMVVFLHSPIRQKQSNCNVFHQVYVWFYILFLGLDCFFFFLFSLLWQFRLSIFFIYLIQTEDTQSESMRVI